MKTVKLKSLVAAIAMLFVSTTAIYAQNPHHVGEMGKGPHGGTVQEADPNHAEILFKDGMLQFFLLDGDAKPLANKGVSGTVVLQFADGSSKKVNLMTMGNESFMADDAKAASFANAVVTFKVNGKSVSAKFKSKDIGKPKQ